MSIAWWKIAQRANQTSEWRNVLMAKPLGGE